MDTVIKVESGNISKEQIAVIKKQLEDSGCTVKLFGNEENAFIYNEIIEFLKDKDEKIVKFINIDDFFEEVSEISEDIFMDLSSTINSIFTFISNAIENGGSSMKSNFEEEEIIKTEAYSYKGNVYQNLFEATKEKVKDELYNKLEYYTNEYAASFTSLVDELVKNRGFREELLMSINHLNQVEDNSSK